MSKLIRLLLLASVLVGLFGAGVANTAPAEAASTLRLSLNPFAPGTKILSGRLENVDPSLAFATVTVTLNDGQSLSVNVDSSTGWQFSFGVLPTDGWMGISVTEHPIPMPTQIGADWDYGYLHGYYYAYPFDGVPWSRFPGYSWAPGYGWGYYPFGYYAWAQYLNYRYSFPYYWTYAPLYTTPTYIYYGVAGLPTTYLAPTYRPYNFGTIYQPYYLTVASKPAIYSTSTTYQPLVYSAYTYNTAPIQTYAAPTIFQQTIARAAPQATPVVMPAVTSVSTVNTAGVIQTAQTVAPPANVKPSIAAQNAQILSNTNAANVQATAKINTVPPVSSNPVTVQTVGTGSSGAVSVQTVSPPPAPPASTASSTTATPNFVPGVPNQGSHRR